MAFLKLHTQTKLVVTWQNLISNVSHELRTPLARIRLFNELLLEDKQPDEVKRRHYRRKLGDDVEKPRIIETVYGFGYRLAH